MIGAHVARRPHRIASFVLLAGGVLLVFAGLTIALGLSASGVIASGAAIAALLYAGAVWFGASAHGEEAVILFTPQLTVAAVPEQEHCRSGRGLASKKSIEADGDDDAADDGGGVHVGRLPVRIERGEKQQSRQASRDRARDDFRDDVNAALRTAVSFGQVAMA